MIQDSSAPTLVNQATILCTYYDINTDKRGIPLLSVHFNKKYTTGLLYGVNSNYVTKLNVLNRRPLSCLPKFFGLVELLFSL